MAFPRIHKILKKEKYKQNKAFSGKIKKFSVKRRKNSFINQPGKIDFKIH